MSYKNDPVPEITLEELKESLDRLEKFVTLTSDESTGLFEFQQDTIDQFLACNEQLETLLQDYYWALYSEQEVPEEGRVGTVLAEMVSARKLHVNHVTDLFDQFTSATFLFTSNWLTSLPSEAGFLKEILEKIPLYHQRMVELVIVLEAEPVQALQLEYESY